MKELVHPAGFSSVYDAVREAASVETAIHCIRDHYGVDHATYHLARTISGGADSPCVRSTYPAKWLTRYLIKGYVLIDPVVLKALERQLPFDWRELEPTTAALGLMQDAMAHGLGKCGYTIPITDKKQRKALFSVNASTGEDEWTTFVETHAAGLAELAHCLHRKVLVELYGEEDPVPGLTMREIECLTWTAQGKDDKSISILLGLSVHTTRGYLKSARYKLDCATLSQAVAKAIKLRVISP